MYDAAKRLYARFRPMLEEHLASSPFAKVAFVGHSLGGSLGSLLMLMFLHRGVLPHSAVSPTYTFGAPAIFCEACGPGGTCALNTSAEPPRDDKQQKMLPSASSEVASPPFWCILQANLILSWLRFTMIFFILSWASEYGEQMVQWLRALLPGAV